MDLWSISSHCLLPLFIFLFLLPHFIVPPFIFLFLLLRSICHPPDRIHKPAFLFFPSLFFHSPLVNISSSFSLLPLSSCQHFIFLLFSSTLLLSTYHLPFDYNIRLCNLHRTQISFLRNSLLLLLVVYPYIYIHINFFTRRPSSLTSLFPLYRPPSFDHKVSLSTNRLSVVSPTTITINCEGRRRPKESQ